MAAERRVDYVKALLDEIGLGRDRLDMFFISSAEGAHWAEIVTEMTERIRELGPNPLRTRDTPVPSGGGVNHDRS